MTDPSSEDLELQRLRMEKMQQLMQAKKSAEARANRKVYSLADKIDLLLGVLLTPEAARYLKAVKQNKISVYNGIRQLLFPPQITSEIDMLISYYQQGMIRRGSVSLTEIQIMERKMLGVGTNITIKKQGHDATTLGSYLKDDD